MAWREAADPRRQWLAEAGRTGVVAMVIVMVSITSRHINHYKSLLIIIVTVIMIDSSNSNNSSEGNGNGTGNSNRE